MASTTTEQAELIEQPERERRTVTLRVDQAGLLVIPADIVSATGLEPGESVELERTILGILLVPIRTDEEMEAVWGPNWLADLAEAKADAAMGHMTFHASTEEFLAALDAHADANPQGD